MFTTFIAVRERLRHGIAIRIVTFEKYCRNLYQYAPSIDGLSYKLILFDCLTTAMFYRSLYKSFNARSEALMLVTILRQRFLDKKIDRDQCCESILRRSALIEEQA